MAALFTLTTFLAAVLLFSVQPLVTRLLLPSLGGAPSVWNTAMVFFQAVLLVGYGYAHYFGKKFKQRRWTMVWFHGAFLLLPLSSLPLALPARLPASASGEPVLWLLGLLSVCVGLPFFVLSTSSPILQRAFALTPHSRAKDPYFLYAASNAGSLLALLSYPVAVEPNLSLSTQTRVWMFGYWVFIPCMLSCLWLAAKSSAAGGGSAEHTQPLKPVEWRRRWRWILLAFAPSSLMLSVTTYLSTDVVAIPLMWILPLSLYLLSFMVVFAGRSWIPAGQWVRPLPGLLSLLVLVLAGQVSNPRELLVSLHLLVFFVAAVVCHGELARDRPPAAQLTEFYSWMAFGGVLGGAFNALIAPQVFHGVTEYGITVVLVALLSPGAGRSTTEKRAITVSIEFLLTSLRTPVLIGGFCLGLIFLFQNSPLRQLLRNSGLLGTPLPLVITIGLPILLCLLLSKNRWNFGLSLGSVLLAAHFYQGGYKFQVVHAERSFFGIHKVFYIPNINSMHLVHGSTRHGVQKVGDRTPVSYYRLGGPAHDIIDAARLRHGRRRTGDSFRVAVVGLGCGVLAGYIRAGEEWTFYEIDPSVARIAQDPKLFTYWSGAPAAPKLVLGDARIELMDSHTRSFDLILLDAYSSDTIPVHLVTKEALDLYISKLKNDGLIGWHISNNHFDLEPVVGQLAAGAGWISRIRHDIKLTSAQKAREMTSSHWACLAEEPADLGGLASSQLWEPLRRNAPLWTDDYSSLWTVLWRPREVKGEKTR